MTDELIRTGFEKWMHLFERARQGLVVSFVARHSDAVGSRLPRGDEKSRALCLMISYCCSVGSAVGCWNQHSLET